MLTKDCRKFLKFLNHHNPDYCNRAFTYTFLEKEYPDSIENIFRICRYLVKTGYIEIFIVNDAHIGVVLTEPGAHPYQFKWEQIKVFLLKSVIVPIIVSAITAFLTVHIN